MKEGDKLFYLNIEGIQKLKDKLMIKLMDNQDENHTTIILFPGDVQLSYQEMESDKATKEYQHECYEETIKTLYLKYPNTNIIIIRPTRRDLVIISEFDNFYIAGKAILHLNRLLNNTKKVLENGKLLFLIIDFKIQVNYGKNFILMAFSKGCVVLNNIISDFGSLFFDKYELWASEHFENQVLDIYRIKSTHKKQGYKDLQNYKKEIIEFWEKISEIHFLDVHRGITNKNLLLKILDYESKRNKIKIFVHATPYLYLNNESIYRRHIKPEIDEFVSIMKCFFKLYLKDKPMSLQHHFDLLRIFEIKED